MFLSSFIKESPEGQYRAEIHENSDGYLIEYYDPTGKNFRTETFAGKSLKYVSDAAENWVAGIKSLNG